MTPKRKILIVNNNMHIGGVQKALVSLLWNIRGQYDVTLLLFYKGGELLKELPPDVQVISVDSAYRYLGMTRADTRAFGEKLGRMFYAAVSRIMGRKTAVSLMALGQRKLTGYDVAISYLHNSSPNMFYGGCNDFVLKHVSAKKKIAFLHCDYQNCGADTKENAKQYAAFDVIAACSEGCAASFLRANPALKEKTRVVYNCHRFDRICQDAEVAAVEMQDDVINLVTVARLGKEKGVDRALRAIAMLGPEKAKLHYYIIGDGVQMPLMKKIITREQLEETVTLCGMLENPYGYIRRADMLLIPSYSEAAPLVVGEAACLGTPVLSTRTSSAKEMIEDSGCGWVCENSEPAMAELLRLLLRNTEQISDREQHLRKVKIDNERSVEQFTNLIVQ